MRELRTRKHLTLKKMAKALGIPYTSVQDYEQGRVEPKAHRLEEIADVLETNTEYLMGRIDYPKKLTPLHNKVWDALERNDRAGIEDALRQYLMQKGIGKKPITRKKPPLT